jgi:hypothetical protein
MPLRSGAGRDPPAGATAAAAVDKARRLGHLGNRPRALELPVRGALYMIALLPVSGTFHLWY